MIRWMADFTRLRAVGLSSICLRRYVGRRRGETEIPFSELLTVERMAFGNGLRLHLRSHQPIVVLVKRRSRRSVESTLRDHGVQIVDEYGCRIDQSQFEKESDPRFNRKIGPGFWPRRRPILPGCSRINRPRSSARPSGGSSSTPSTAVRSAGVSPTAYNPRSTPCQLTCH